MENLNRQSYTEAPLPSLQELESAIDASQLNADVITTYGTLPPTASSSSIEPVAEMTQTAPIESSTATPTSAPAEAAQSTAAAAMPPPSASFPSSQAAPQSPQTSKPTSATQPHAPLPTPPRHLESNPLFRSIAASTSAYPHLHPQPLHDPPSDFSKPIPNGVPTSASQSLIHSNPHHSHLHHNGYSGQLARYGSGVGGAGTSSGMAGHVHPHMAPGVGGFYAGAHTPAVSRPSSPFSLNTPVDYDGLSWPSVGTRARLDETPEEKEARIQKLSGALKTVLECIGEDPTREGLLGTPERYAKAMLFFTKGYEENLRDIVNGAVFTEDHDELVIVKDIDVFSLCEHHLVPFTGKMHIGYIPNRRVIGLSKLARIAEMFSRRLQVQERLTKQVALAVSEILSPQGVAVVMESTHMCMVMRGVQKSGAITTTSCMLGRMRQSAKTREEFLNLLKR